MPKKGGAAVMGNVLNLFQQFDSTELELQVLC